MVCDSDSHFSCFFSFSSSTYPSGRLAMVAAVDTSSNVNAVILTSIDTWWISIFTAINGVPFFQMHKRSTRFIKQIRTLNIGRTPKLCATLQLPRQDSEPLILSKVMNDLVIIKYDINAIKKDADLHIYTLYLSHVLGSKLQRNSRAKGFLNDFKINAFK